MDARQKVLICEDDGVLGEGGAGSGWVAWPLPLFQAAQNFNPI